MLSLVSFLAALGFIALGALLSTVMPVFGFPKPTGTFAVGTASLHLVDHKRQEMFSQKTNAPREIMIQIWYPAESDGRQEPERYLSNLMGMKTAREVFGTRFSQLDFVTTHSHRDATLSKAQNRYPILIFSPSWSGSRNQNTFEVEDLASHGFIVVGIDHAYCTGVTVFPDQRVVLADSSLDLDLSTEQALQKYIQTATAQARLRAQDAIFVVDKLEKIGSNEAKGMFAGRLDLQRIGIFGHSFGGTVAAQACYMDKRFKAGLNMDGMFFGDFLDKKVTQPFMIFNSDETRPTADEIAHSIYAKLDDRAYKLQDAFLARNGGYNLTIKNARHLNFADTALFSPLRRLTGAGRIDTQRCMHIVNNYTLAFFECYLNDHPSALLNGPSAAFPEVIFEKHRAKNDSPAATATTSESSSRK
jgi:hypothetical protein